jgi:puromycin-sensitive aminopeptidase
MPPFHVALTVFLVPALVSLASRSDAQRLPTNVLPDHYEIAVEPDLAAAAFAGSERISVTLERPARAITLNAAEIKFESVTITAGGTTQPARVALDAVREQATFTVPKTIAAGPAEIRIKYAGILNDQLRGLYLSKANNRRYAVTQLEATDARRMFPSFDEPAMKATYALSATIDKGDHAISNGAVASDTPGPKAGKHTVTFETTPRMSTYLLALAVGDFECSSGSADGIPIRVCATPDKKGQVGLALEAASEILKYYDRYYGIKYPFKKLDVVAVPDFAAGAMENTAAIFYRETLLVADPKTASVKVRKDMASVLAHEMAHQWFGDLVTMRWWDDIWLNEGFATWMASKPLKAWKADWHMDLDEVQSNQKAMSVDSLESTRPIRAKVSTPDEINELFDAITYQKGGAVLRMVEAWVGEESFRAGINAYLEQFKYGNATAEDFWTTVAKVTGKPVDRVMSGFVDQPGVPLVGVALKCTDGRSTATVGPQPPTAASGTSNGTQPNTWNIPVCVRTPDGKPTCELAAAAPVSVPLESCPAAVIANAGARGYYRVVTPPPMLRAIAANIKAVTPAERIALLADEWVLVRTGVHNIDSFMDLANGFNAEQSAPVVTTLADALKSIGRIATPASRRTFNAWVAGLLGPSLERVGWTPKASESDDTRELRGSLVLALGETANDPSAITKSREIVLQELARPGTVEPSLLNAAVTVAAKHGDAALYDNFLQRSKAASSPEEHYRYMYALASFSDPALVKRTVDYIVGPEVRSQDAKLFIADLLGNYDAQRQAWRLLQDRWPQLEKKTGQFGGTTVVIAALGTFCDTRTLGEVRRFFAVHKAPDAVRTLEQALERIQQCSAVAATEPARLAGWLTTRPGGTAGGLR